MTLSLTAAQTEVLALMGQDGAEPLYYARFDTGIVIPFIVTATAPVSGETIVITAPGAGSGTISIQWGATHQPNSGIAGIAGSQSGNAANLADTWRAEGLGAWAQGNLVWVRMDDDDDSSATVSGTGYGSGKTVQSNGNQTPQYYEFVSGRITENIPPSIAAVGTVGQEKNRGTKVSKITKRNIFLQWDAITEDMVTRNVMIGRKVTIRRGVASYPVSDWIPSGVHIIVDGPYSEKLGTIKSDGSSYTDIERPFMRLDLEDAASSVLKRFLPDKDALMLPDIIAQHPLEAIQTIYRQAFHQENLSVSDYVDETLLDPELSDWDETEHWQIARTTLELYSLNDDYWPFINGVTPARPQKTNLPDLVKLRYESGVEKESAQKLLDEIMLVLPAQLTTSELGIVECRRVDYSTISAGSATIFDWSDKFTPSAQPESHQRLFNQILYEIGASVDTGQAEYGKFWRQVYGEKDEASASAHNIRGVAAALRSMRIEQKMLSASSWMRAVQTATNYLSFAMESTATQIDVAFAHPLGFCGARSDHEADPDDIVDPPTWAQLGTNRKAYLRLKSPVNHWAVSGSLYTGSRPSAVEVLECDGCSINNSGPGKAYGQYSFSSLNPTPDGVRYAGGWYRYDISARDVDSNGAPDWWISGCPIADITIARFLAADTLDPFRWGFPVIEGWTGLDQLDKQIGDFVTIPLPHLTGFNGIGATDLQMTFEILGKEEQRDRVRWKVGLADRGEPFIASIAPIEPATPIPAIPEVEIPLQSLGDGAIETSGTATGEVNDL